MNLAVVIIILPGWLFQKQINSRNKKDQMQKIFYPSLATFQFTKPRSTSPQCSSRTGLSSFSATSTIYSPNPHKCHRPRTWRKIAHFEASFQIRDRSRQKKNDAFRSLKISDHTKMLQLMVADDYIIQVEADFEETKKKTVSWLHRAEKCGAERYKEFAPLIDKNSSPPPRATEWGILSRQLEI